ncbi:MAG: hypothetical protein PUI65_08670, partial [Prevotella sp.]|nr:hypothetical protein [Prevotella sp.]
KRNQYDVANILIIFENKHFLLAFFYLQGKNDIFSFLICYFIRKIEKNSRKDFSLILLFGCLVVL